MLALRESSTNECVQSVLVLEPVYQHAGLGPCALPPGQHTLGSGDDCTLRIQLPGVHPRHAVITAEGRRAMLQAFDARTWLNEIPVKEAVLQAGDRLAIGPVEFQLQIATLPQRLENSNGLAQPHEAAGQRAANGQAAVGANALGANIEVELVQQVRQLQEEILKQDRKLQEQLDRHATTAVQVERQQHDTGDANRRIGEVQRREGLVKELMADLSTQAEETLRRQSEIEERKNAIAQQESELNSRRAELRQNEIAFAELQEEKVQQQSQIGEVQTDLAAQSQSLSEEQERLEALERDLLQRSDELDGKSEELAREESKLRRQHAQIDRHQEQSDEKKQHRQEEDEQAESQLAAHKSQLDEERTTLEADRTKLQAERESHNQACAELEQARQQAEAAAAEAEASRIRSEEERSDFQQQLQQQRDELSQREQEFEARRTQFDDECAAREVETSEAREQATAEATRLAEQTADLQQQLSELNNEREALAGERRSLEAERQQITAEAEQLRMQHEQPQLPESQSLLPESQLPESQSLLPEPLEQLPEPDAGEPALDCERFNPASSLPAAPHAMSPPTEQPDMGFDNSGVGHASTEPVFESQVQQPPETAEETSALRNTLASMFGIDETQLQEQQPVDSIRVDEDPVPPCSDTDPMIEPGGPAELATGALEGLEPPQFSDLELPTELELPTAEEPTSQTPPEAGAEDSSIASYMESLLARNRGTSNSSGVSEFRPVQPPKPEASQPEQREQQDQQQDQRESAETGAAEPAVDLEPPQPKYQQNKEAVRANLNSLREVANLSARSAIATHTGKQLRGKVLVKVILATASFGVAGALLTSRLWSSTSYTFYGSVALGIGCVMAVDLVASTVSHRRKNGSRKDSDRSSSDD